MKNLRQLLVTVLLCGTALSANAQKVEMQWHNPLEEKQPAVSGRYWNKEIGKNYTRLPQRAKSLVRSELWRLSLQSAGLFIPFYSNAPKIIVKYTVKGGYSMPHMPATGVSGIDLYSIDNDGKELWCQGQYSFGDTITYCYDNLSYHNYHNKGNEYQLFLPLYNEVSSLQIGTEGGSFFQFIPEQAEKPIVVYGTSIAQGACASRPGMAWTNILQRETGSSVINLGFSGNGQLESEMFNLLSEIDAQIYIIDCMPNMTNDRVNLIEERTVAGVKRLREKSAAPILLVEHDGYNGGSASDKKKKEYDDTNKALQKAYATLQNDGVKDLYYLSKKDLAISLDAQVDGVHASDLGMMQYASAYKRKVDEILHRSKPLYAFLTPCKQHRDFDTYEWNARFNDVIAFNREKSPECVMIGNSITHFWAGEPASTRISGAKSWKKLFGKKRVVNMGFGWDRIENVIWRIEHGQLSGFNAKKIFLMIGTNNLDFNTNEEIVDGIVELSRIIRSYQPTAHLYVVKIYPRHNMEPRIMKLNNLLQDTLKENKSLSIIDCTQELVQKNGQINETLFLDGLHPNEEGYMRIANKMKQYVE